MEQILSMERFLGTWQISMGVAAVWSSVYSQSARIPLSKKQYKPGEVLGDGSIANPVAKKAEVKGPLQRPRDKWDLPMDPQTTQEL